MLVAEAHSAAAFIGKPRRQIRSLRDLVGIGCKGIDLCFSCLKAAAFDQKAFAAYLTGIPALFIRCRNFQPHIEMLGIKPLVLYFQRDPGVVPDLFIYQNAGRSAKQDQIKEALGFAGSGWDRSAGNHKRKALLL